MVGRGQVVIALRLGGLREVAHDGGLAPDIDQRQGDAELHLAPPMSTRVVADNRAACDTSLADYAVVARRASRLHRAQSDAVCIGVLPWAIPTSARLL